MSLWLPPILVAIVILAIGLRCKSSKPPHRLSQDELAGDDWRITEGELILFDDCCATVEDDEVLAVMLSNLKRLLESSANSGQPIIVHAIEVSAPLARTLYKKGLLHKEDLCNARSGLGGTIDIDSFEVLTGVPVRLSILRVVEYPFHFVVIDEEGTSHTVRDMVDFVRSLSESLTRDFR